MKFLEPLKCSKGMTLMEIMIVIVILGSLMTILGTRVMDRLGGANVKQAKIQIAEVGKQLEAYYLDCQSYPSTGEGLQALMSKPASCESWGPDPYLRKLPRDPWGTELVYESDGASYTLTSLGKDKRDGGEGANADIKSE